MTPIPEQAVDIVKRLRSSEPLPACPYDKLSPHYWTAPDDKPCAVCGGLNDPDAPDLCRGADTRIMGEAADEIERLRAAHLLGTVGREAREEIAWAICPSIREYSCGEGVDSTCLRCPETIHTAEGVGIQACRHSANVAADAILALRPALPAPAGWQPFQQRVLAWMMECFSMEICRDGTERNHRFLEEALELVQSLGCTRSEAHQLVDYVFDRPAGDPKQELGGVMVTIAALCFPNDLDMTIAAEAELARVWSKIDTIRAKQAAKPKHSPLPAAPATEPKEG